ARDRERFTPLVLSFFIAAYEAEIFLSLDAEADGEEFLREELASADTDEERLSRAIMLGQVLLIRGKHREYTKLTTGTVAPLLRKVLSALPANDFLAPSIA